MLAFTPIFGHLGNVGLRWWLPMLKHALSPSRPDRGPVIVPAIIAVLIAAWSAPAAADPRIAPTVQYVLDVEITRASDHSINVPARYVYTERRIRIELVGIVTLVDLDRKQTTTMIPRVRTYWRPVALKKPAADGRRWVGVEAATAEEVGTDTLLERSVTKYRVRGTIFEDQIPFEGDVWTTAENIVLKVEGTGRVDGFSSPIKVNPVQLTVVPVDAGLLTVPSTFARASKSEGGHHPED
ncbi:MAG: hypothetical protein HYX37_03525 [Rhizobiales bacterium]|nr:hypothetical protein [Hyphomicrobiales bacterium]